MVLSHPTRCRILDYVIRLLPVLPAEKTGGSRPWTRDWPHRIEPRSPNGRPRWIDQKDRALLSRWASARDVAEALAQLTLSPKPVTQPIEAHGAFHQEDQPRRGTPTHRGAGCASRGIPFQGAEYLPNGRLSWFRRWQTETSRHPGFPHPPGPPGGAVDLLRNLHPAAGART